MSHQGIGAGSIYKKSEKKIDSLIVRNNNHIKFKTVTCPEVWKMGVEP